MIAEVKKHSAFKAQVIGVGGNSVGVIIPKAITKYIGISEHDHVEIIIKKVSVKPI
jgi:antitoxin component of MazEF toxin-antitoxin module